MTNWGAEMGGPNALIRNGWTRNTLKIGTLVSFTGSLAKDGSHRVNASRILVDGKPLRPASSEGAGRSVLNGRSDNHHEAQTVEAAGINCAGRYSGYREARFIITDYGFRNSRVGTNHRMVNELA